MKKFTAVAAALLLVAAIVLPISAAPDWGKTPNLVVMGDSISNGYGVDLGDNYCYLVSNEIGATYNNISQDGLTSEGLVNKLKVESFCNEVKKADLIMFTIGGNDLIAAFLKIASAYSGTAFTGVDEAAGYLSKLEPAKLNEMLSAESAQTQMAAMLMTYKANLNAILAKLKELNPESEIFVLTQYNPMSGVASLAGLDRAAEPIFAELNKVMAEEAAAAGAYIIDIYEVLKGKGNDCTYIAGGDIHPNIQGHKKIADAIIDYLEENIMTKPEWTVPETTTAAPTEAPTETEGTTPAPTDAVIADKGCAGVSVIALLAAAVVGVALVVIKKK